MSTWVDPASRAKKYFSCSAWRRILAAVWNKYSSLGRVGGNAVVKQLSDAESEALNSFFGWNCKAGDTETIPLALFDEELRTSGFAPMNLLRLHVLLEGRPLLTKEEKRLLEDEQWNDLFQAVRYSLEASLCPVAEEWLSRVEAGVGAGGRSLRELYKTNPELARSSVEIVVRTLNKLFPAGGSCERKPIRLPVLAVRVSGDAHALDMNRPAGRMLVAILREKLSGWEDPGEADIGADTSVFENGSETLKLRESYRRFGILDDDLSSIVYWYVPKRGEPVLPNVWTLSQVEAAETLPRCSTIFVVENPAVFSTLLDSLPESLQFAAEPPALVCTSGPASAAAIRWIERCLVQSGDRCKITYSGDFDIKGLSMGQNLAARFPDRFVPWRFDSDAYLSSIRKQRGPLFEEGELLKLAEMEVPWDGQLCSTMIRVGCKVHHEILVETLMYDFYASVKDCASAISGEKGGE